jgi:hypothetical protein
MLFAILAPLDVLLVADAEAGEKVVGEVDENILAMDVLVVIAYAILYVRVVPAERVLDMGADNLVDAVVAEVRIGENALDGFADNLGGFFCKCHIGFLC